VTNYPQHRLEVKDLVHSLTHLPKSSDRARLISRATVASDISMKEASSLADQFACQEELVELAKSSKIALGYYSRAVRYAVTDRGQVVGWVSYGQHAAEMVM
jgi:hypothetical protein